jgi:hypothetical protein
MTYLQPAHANSRKRNNLYSQTIAAFIKIKKIKKKKREIKLNYYKKNKTNGTSKLAECRGRKQTLALSCPF